MSALDTFPVPVVLYVEDDDAEGARATVQTILESAGGSDLAERPDGTTFGFAVEPPGVAEEIAGAVADVEAFLDYFAQKGDDPETARTIAALDTLLTFARGSK